MVLRLGSKLTPSLVGWPRFVRSLLLNRYFQILSLSQGFQDSRGLHFLCSVPAVCTLLAMACIIFTRFITRWIEKAVAGLFLTSLLSSVSLLTVGIHKVLIDVDASLCARIFKINLIYTNIVLFGDRVNGLSLHHLVDVKQFAIAPLDAVTDVDLYCLRLS